MWEFIEKSVKSNQENTRGHLDKANWKESQTMFTNCQSIPRKTLLTSNWRICAYTSLYLRFDDSNGNKMGNSK